MTLAGRARRRATWLRALVRNGWRARTIRRDLLVRSRRSRTVPGPSRLGRLGAGSALTPPCTVDGPASVRIGRDVRVGEHAALTARRSGAGIELGDGVRLGRCAAITAAAGVVVEPGVVGGDFVAITDEWGPGEAEPVVVGRGARLGTGCIVGPGVRIGAEASVAPGSVVLSDVAPGASVAGNPAREVAA